MAAGVPTSLRVPFQADHGRRWPAMFLSQDEPPTRDGTSPNPGRYLQPLPGLLIGVILSLSSIAIISSFLSASFHYSSSFGLGQVLTRNGCSPEILRRQTMATTSSYTMGCVRFQGSNIVAGARARSRSSNTVIVVIAIYADSWLFVFATAIIQFGFGVDYSFPVCDSAILLCLVCYVSSKASHHHRCLQCQLSPC